MRRLRNPLLRLCQTSRRRDGRSCVTEHTEVNKRYRCCRVSSSGGGFSSATTHPRRFVNQSAAAATTDATDGVDGWWRGAGFTKLTHTRDVKHVTYCQSSGRRPGLMTDAQQVAVFSSRRSSRRVGGTSEWVLSSLGSAGRVESAGRKWRMRSFPQRQPNRRPNFYFGS